MSQESINAQRLACYYSLNGGYHRRKNYTAVVHQFLRTHPEVTLADQEDMLWIAKGSDDLTGQQLQRRFDKYK